MSAAKACFLPDKDKKNLVNQLEEAYKKQEAEHPHVTFGLD